MTFPRPTEFELIAQYFAPLAAPNAFGLLDDAAIITPPLGHDLVVTKDMLVSERHFFELDPPEAIAAKALRVNLSDLAAKGAKPLGFLLGLALPQDWKPDWIERFVKGLAKDINAYNCPLYGGDTVIASGGLTISITAFGCVPIGTMVRRTTMQLGDSLYVTGTIGDAALGLDMRTLSSQNPFKKNQNKDNLRHLLNRYLLPQPRCGLAEIVREYASASMDISDGFIGDACKILSPNNLALTINSNIVPMSDAAKEAIMLEPKLLKTALTGGDDYELLIAVSPAKQAAFEHAVEKCNVPVTRLGSPYLTEWTSRLGELVILDEAGVPMEFPQKSYTHF
jgi:thiamine-monophosphate kinase